MDTKQMTTEETMNTTDMTTTAQAENMKIDDKVIKKIIALALVEVDGYLGTANNIMSGITSILKKNNASEEEDALSGIGVSMKEHDAEVTVKVITEAGKNIPTIVNDITSNVQRKLAEVAGFTASEVKVEVVDTMTKAEYTEKHSKTESEKKENEQA